MNEQAIIDSYNLFKKSGYSKSLEEFKQLIATNPNALNDSYELFKKNGYKRSLNDYKVLMGVGSQQNPIPVNGDFPPCAVKKGRVQKTPSGASVIVYRTTVWDKPSIQLYAKTNRFLVLDGMYKGKKGNYKCTQTNKLFLELDTVKKVETKKETPKKVKSNIVSTNLTLEDILNGRGSVRIGMKGPVIGEIQNILIALNQSKVSNSGKADNIFGKMTDLAVKQFQGNNMSKGEQDGIVGQKTLKRMIELRDGGETTKKSEYSGMGDDSPEFLQAQLDAQKSQLPVNHGKREFDDAGNTFVWDGYNQRWISDTDYLELYNYDGTKKLQENIIKNIVGKNLHSLL
jgi:peptidoglycan hydrolase-like protein with peptidoglycan-binding domain